MWPHRVVVPPPTFHEDLGLQQRNKLLTSQQLVTKPAVEALALAVLPRGPRLDKQRLHANPGRATHDLLRRELRPVVATDVSR